MSSRRFFPIVGLIFCLSFTAHSQEANPTAQPQRPIEPTQTSKNGIPLYRIQVVGRDIPTINYWHRGGSTRIDFVGTSLLPRARGTAEVNSQQQTHVRVHLEGLIPANSFGVEYLTYVLWAITPQGRPVNLGEIMPKGSKADLQVSTGLQQFALIVTAEPYFAVTMPSDVVVLQNAVSKQSRGIISTVDVHYNLLPRGAYLQETAGRHAVLNPVKPSDKSPLQLYEAINAVQIAEAAGAAKYSPEILAKAKQELSNAQALDSKKSQRKEMITYARGAVQDAEDARISTLRKIQEEKEYQQKQAMLQAQAAAQQAQVIAQQQAAQRVQAQAAAAQAQAAAEQATAQAQLAQAQAARDQAARQSAEQAEQQAEQVRERLRSQLSGILQTRETARGLIVNMSDVLFGFNKYDLKPDAREKLAKVSGILLSYPGLTLQVEGYTDNIGSDQYNLNLSQQRADAVRDFLISQGVTASTIVATGYGKSNPIADNSTAAGRAQNRRVQLVVSGAAIGVQETKPGAQTAPPAVPPAPQNPPSTGVSSPPPQ